MWLFGKQYFDIAGYSDESILNGISFIVYSEDNGSINPDTEFLSCVAYCESGSPYSVTFSLESPRNSKYNMELQLDYVSNQGEGGFDRDDINGGNFDNYIFYKGYYSPATLQSVSGDHLIIYAQIDRDGGHRNVKLSVPFNESPKLPAISSIKVPSSINKGDSVYVSWDDVGGRCSYEVERQYGNLSWTSYKSGIFSGFNDDSISTSQNKVRYRIRYSIYNYQIYSEWSYSDYISIITPNSAPTNPTSITTTPNQTIHSGETVKISWPAGRDPDGDNILYRLQADYEKISGGTENVTLVNWKSSLSYSYTIPEGLYKSVSYKVDCKDDSFTSSGYTHSQELQIINNVSPSIPPSISVPSDITPSINNKIAISWGASTDTDGNLSGYQLERAWDGANSWTQVYKGSSRNFTDTIPRGEHDKVKYRVRAYDSQNAYSGYRESVLRTITNNNIPEIAIETNLVEVTEPFSVTYVVSDDDHDPVTVVERLNDVGIRTLQATLNSPMTCEIDESKFIEMLNGENSIAIYCDDAYEGKNTKSIQFTKNVREVIFKGQKDLSGIDSRFLIFKLNGNLPEDCSVKFEILRNGEYTTILTSDKFVCPIMLLNESVLYYRVSVIRGESDTQGNISQFTIGMI